MKRITALLLLLAVFSFPVLAQVDAGLDPNVPTAVVQAPVQPQSVLGSIFSQFESPLGLMSIVGTVLGVLAVVLKLNADRKRQISTAAYHAFHIVEDIAAETATPIDDKVAAYLKALDDYFKAQGWRALKPGEIEVAKLEAKALNGVAKAAEKQSVNASLAVAEAKEEAKKNSVS